MKNKKKRIVVAMSGGVDSSVVAALYNKNGYEVIGITLQLYSNKNKTKSSKTCCAGQDIYDAKHVASQLGISHYVIDEEKRFKEKVIDDFIDSYKKGITPIPCVKCNQYIKFYDLLNIAKDLGADYLATGHYIKIKDNNGEIGLYKADDKTKDQSYFLFQTKKSDLSFLKFPLGVMSKTETRNIALKLGLIVADKKDSQDICFVPQGDYRKIVNDKASFGNKGNIESNEGKILGFHKGIENFTVGQRRHLNIAIGEPLYVIKIDSLNNKIIVGPKKALLRKEVFLSEVNWLGVDSVEEKKINYKTYVKVRSGHNAVEADIELISENKAFVKFKEPVLAVARGQGCVFYSENEQLLGGGWID